MKHLIKHSLFYIVIIIILGCNLDLGLGIDSLSKLDKICGSASLSDISNSNSVSDECKEAITELLGESQSNINSRILALGRNNEIMYMVISDSNGSPRGLDSIREKISVSAVHGSDTNALTANDYTISRAETDTDIFLSFSTVIDYSGSMSGTDIADASRAFSQLYKYLPAFYESEILFFSTDVTLIQSFTSDSIMLLDGIKKDDTYKRACTSLLDGIGKSINHLKERNSPAKVSLVFTDGLENCSDKFTEKSIKSFLKEKKIPVILFGTLFADASGGIFIYFPIISLLEAKVSEINELIKKIVKLEIINPEYSDADYYEISIGAENIRL
jgi:hypothetical protein